MHFFLEKDKHVSLYLERPASLFDFHLFVFTKRYKDCMADGIEVYLPFCSYLICGNIHRSVQERPVVGFTNNIMAELLRYRSRHDDISPSSRYIREAYLLSGRIRKNKSIFSEADDDLLAYEIWKYHKDFQVIQRKVRDATIKDMKGTHMNHGLVFPTLVSQRTGKSI